MKVIDWYFWSEGQGRMQWTRTKTDRLLFQVKQGFDHAKSIKLVPISTNASFNSQKPEQSILTQWNNGRRAFHYPHCKQFIGPIRDLILLDHQTTANHNSILKWKQPVLSPRIPITAIPQKVRHVWFPPSPNPWNQIEMENGKSIYGFYSGHTETTIDLSEQPR